MGACSSHLQKNNGNMEILSQRQGQKNGKQDAACKSDKVKLLILGPSASGKSTFFKQFDILYKEPWTVEERQAYRPIIFENTIGAMKSLLSDGFRALGKTTIRAELRTNADQILGVKKNDGGKYNLTPQIAATIETLWKEPLVQRAFNKRCEYQLCDSANYFFRKVRELACENYVPSNQDIVRSQAFTTGNQKKTYKIDGVEFELVDVGGRRNERKNWAYCVNDATAMLFMADLSGYDKVLEGNEHVNRLKEALDLFEFIVNQSDFQNKSILLFLNKFDLFQKLIKNKSLRNDQKNWFTDYEGGCDPDLAYKYIVNRFCSTCRDKSKKIFVRPTTAISTRSIEDAFDAAREVALPECNYCFDPSYA